ncbi:MAG: VCBS repeat-containing protein, partial [Acidobacteria bacterium]
ELTRLRGQDARNRTPAELEMSRYTEIVEPERTRSPQPANVQPSGVKFTDVTTDAGILPDAGDQNALPGAVSWVDLNADSLQDLCLMVGGRKPAFWLNNGAGTFKPLSADLPVLLNSPAHAWGDLDYDGDVDLCLTGKELILVFSNDGSGRVTKAGELAVGPAALKDLLLVDYDHDGDLDLYVAQAASPPRMFQNDGKGAFTPVRPETGLSPAGAAVERILFLDFDDDNDTDFLLTQSGLPNLLLSNLRVGAFADIARQLGLDSPSDNRNVIATDLNNDEWRDLVFLRKSGDLSAGLGTKAGKYQSLSLGRVTGPASALASLDYDNDGDEDLFAAGRLFQNDGRFSDFTAVTGLESLTGSAVQACPEDFDGDGDLDLAVCLENGSLRLLRNDGGNRNQWVRIRLEGLQSNRFGVATKVEVREGSFFQRKICDGGPLLFGIGQRRDVDVVRMWWPTGVAQNILAPALKQTTLVKEKLGPPSSCPFLYLWDGKKFSFFTDVLDVAALGVPLANGKMLPHANKEDLLIPGTKVKYKDGRIVFQITGELREIVYLDSVRLSYVDHSTETEVYPMDWAGSPPGPSRLGGFRDLRPALNARTGRNEDVTSILIARDGRYAARGIRLTRFYGLADSHSLILDFGDLAGLKHPALLLQGWVNWIDGDTLYALGQGAGPSPYGPRLEVQKDNGPWMTVSENIGLPGGIDKHVIVRLPSGLCGKSTRVRISTNLEVYWDRTAVGNLTVEEDGSTGNQPLISSDLHFRGFSRLVRGVAGVPPHYAYHETGQEAPWRPQQGFFTRFGEVSALLASTDDRLVVFGPGDEITLTFATPPPAMRGTTRDYILHLSGWIKDANPSTRTGDRVDPLPTRTMTNYPFGAEPNPMDRDYWETVDRYNTRVLGRR